MNAPAKTDPCVIVVPSLLVSLIGDLVTRMAKVTGEPEENVRRAVEQSILSQGAAAVQSEISAMENQAERMGWPR
jgi:hypothetical protein